jgi:hypothetical protein
LPIHHGHELIPSGSCQSSKSGFPSNQYPQPAQFQLYGHVRNDESRAAHSTATPDPDWWSYINPEFVSSETHQECQSALASVSNETSSAHEFGMESMSATFQPASQSFGFSQQPSHLNTPANYDIEIDQRAPLARPDDTNCMVATNFISTTQPDWDSMPSSSTLHSLCDLYESSNRLSTPPGNDTIYQESQETAKTQIPVLPYFKCSHCARSFTVKRNLRCVLQLSDTRPFTQKYRSHIQDSHKRLQHPNICNCCGKQFTLSKDLKRHQQTVSSTRPFACTCERNYPRKDHLQRHIRTMNEKLGVEKHHAVQADLNN